MKKFIIAVFALVGVLLASSSFAVAGSDSRNRISFAFQALVGPKVSYGSLLGTPPPPAALANDETRLYLDGHVAPGKDGPGMFTENWGHESSDQIGDPDIVQMHHLSTPPVPDDSVRKQQYGFEAAFSRRLWESDRKRFEAGFVVAGGLLPLDGFGTHELVRGWGTLTTDTYWSPDFNDPSFPPPVPYEGTADGDGPRLKMMPARTSSPVEAETSVRRELDGVLITGRMGPYIGYNLGRLSLLGSAGLAVGFSDAEFRSSSTTKASGHVFRTTARESSTDALLGGFARGDVLYRFAERWSFEAGAQFLTLGTHRLEASGGESAALRLKNMIGFSAGVSYRF